MTKEAMTLEKSARTVKLLFLFVNAVLFVSGCVLLGVGAWSMCEFGAYEDLSPSVPYAAASKLVIAAGIFNVLVSFFGCWLASKENRRLFIIFCVVLLVILGLEISAAALGYQNRNKIRDTLSDDVLHVLREVYGIKTEPSNALRALQEKGKCCGWYNYTDWRDSWFTQEFAKGNNFSIVPDSCCKEPRERRCGTNFTMNNIYTKGCQGVFLYKIIRETLHDVAVTAVIATVIQVVGVLFVLVMTINRAEPGEQLPLHVKVPRI